MFSSFAVSTNMLPKERDSHSGKLLIASSGRCVWNDISQIRDIQNYDIMCVNDMVMHFPLKVDHFYTNDYRMLSQWLSARRPRYKKDFEESIVSHCCYDPPKGVIKWPWPGHGTSSLNAVYTGLALGYDEILIAGVPLDNSGHYFDPPWVESKFENEVPNRDFLPRHWKDAKEKVFQGKVKSLSGRTKQLLNP